MNNIAINPSARNLIDAYRIKQSIIKNETQKTEINKLRFLCNEQFISDLLHEILVIDKHNIVCTEAKIKYKKSLHCKMTICNEILDVQIRILNPKNIKIIIFGHMFLFEPSGIKDYTLEYDINNGYVNQEITYNSDKIFKTI
jgi:hypothetical protein